jgi:ADP-heptose:LPS heptosyltransferase
LVEPAASSLLRTQTWIDEVIVFPRNTLVEQLQHLKMGPLSRTGLEFLRHLRHPSFDLVVDFHSIFRSGLLSMATGARTRVAYARPFGREGGYLFAHRRARLREVRMSRFERNAGLVDFLAVGRGGDGSAAARFVGSGWLDVDLKAVAALSETLGSGPRPAVIHPGTSVGTPYKRYTTEGYAAVARGLAAKMGTPTLVSCGPSLEERELALAIVAKAGESARLAPATPTLGDLAALFAYCRLFVGADSGPLHLASGVGTPVVQILGPTDPVENAPNPSTPSRSVGIGIECSPCRRGCAAARCMTGVAPDAVLAAALELLEASPASGAAQGGWE